MSASEPGVVEPGVIVLRAAAVLFDCDGVLVDSDASVERAWTRWAGRFNLDPVQVTAMVHGRRAVDSVQLLIEPAVRIEALTAINAYELDDAVSVTAISGARELVADIPTSRWAIVTSGNRELAPARIAAAGIPSPGVLVTANDIDNGKPAPDGYLAAAAALAVPAAETIVVEDSISGIEAGRRAGVKYVVGVGPRAMETDADVVVADLGSLRWADGLVIRAALRSAVER